MSAPGLFSQTHGGRIAAKFCERYPDVRLELIGEERCVDLVEDGYDLAIFAHAFGSTAPPSEMV